MLGFDNGPGQTESGELPWGAWIWYGETLKARAVAEQVITGDDLHLLFERGAFLVQLKMAAFSSNDEWQALYGSCNTIWPYADLFGDGSGYPEPQPQTFKLNYPAKTPQMRLKRKEFEFLIPGRRQSVAFGVVTEAMRAAAQASDSAGFDSESPYIVQLHTVAEPLGLAGQSLTQTLRMLREQVDRVIQVARGQTAKHPYLALTDYQKAVLDIIVQLKAEGTTPASARKIAQKLNPASISKTMYKRERKQIGNPVTRALSPLKRKGLVESVGGRKGGYRLTIKGERMMVEAQTRGYCSISNDPQPEIPLSAENTATS